MKRAAWTAWRGKGYYDCKNHNNTTAVNERSHTRDTPHLTQCTPGSEHVQGSTGGITHFYFSLDDLLRKTASFYSHGGFNVCMYECVYVHMSVCGRCWFNIILQPP